eukprot:GHVR01165173.1.p1 GENE.GHVR01165173.1~~GHVR01165173.1.p1  ORF type:complete len:138 (+),score=22.25 GHVR01165173.1:662-1075(+)
MTDNDFNSMYNRFLNCDDGILEVTPVPQVSLADVLTRAAVTHIHYLSLDVEGAELEALMGIDWSAITVDVISVETPNSNQSYNSEVENHLIERGFEKVWRMGVDTILVHQDFARRHYVNIKTQMGAFLLDLPLNTLL